MNIQERLKKIERNNPNKSPCFCGHTFLDLWTGDADGLTYCPNCRDQFDYWQKLAIDAVTSDNLTDIKKEAL